MPAYKNQFVRPDHYDHEILCSNGAKPKVGTIRVKPGGILWKPVGQQRFYSVNSTNSKLGSRIQPRARRVLAASLVASMPVGSSQRP